MKASKLVASFFVLGLPAALYAGGCSITANGGGGGGSCASVCANYPSCGNSNNSSCMSQCNQLQSACSSAGKSGIFEDWASCGPQYACQGGQVQQTNCVQQAFELLQCPNSGSSSGSSSGKSGSSSGKSGSSSGGSNSSSGGSNSSSGGSNSSSGGSNSSSGGSNSSSGGNSSSSSGGSSSGGPPPPCYANTPYTVLPWAPPTNLHQNVCTAALVTAFTNSLMTSGDATCDACILTDYQASMLGPVVTMGGTPLAANWGGCMADFDNSKGAGSCGNTFNSYNDCFAAECATCSDWSNGGPVTQSCGQAAFGNGGPCAADTATQACIAEIQNNGIAASCGPMLTNLITVWCGP